MAKIIIVGQCKDPVQWEKGFRTHTELFKRQTTTKVSYAVAEGNHIAVCFEPQDVAAALKTLDSPETAQAMETDGFLQDTAKIFVLEKEFNV
ncbi:MAG: hypothetical protein ABI231_12540 [Candidatus Tumulicola sp.]